MGVSLRTFIRTVRLQAESVGGSATPASICEGLLTGLFESSIENGRTIIRSAEAGGMTEFAIPAGLTPSEVMNLATQALDWIEAQDTPENPELPTDVRRLRPCFSRVTL